MGSEATKFSFSPKAITSGAATRAATMRPDSSLQEMAKLYNEISIVIRFPEHDSLSISIMEAMFKAKIIIYRYEQECTIQAKTLEEMIQRIEEQIQNPPHYNIAAREYALNHFTEETVRSQFRMIKEKYNLK